MQAAEVVATSPAVKRLLKRRLNNLNVKPRIRKRKVQVNKLAVAENERDPEEEIYFAVEDFEQPSMEVFVQGKGRLPPNSIVHRDVVEQFLKHRPEEKGKRLVIAARLFDDLRVTYPTINRSSQQVECIMDNGSQIVSMNTSVAAGLNLAWDPDLVIHMESANSTVSPTRGLARNVPFKFSDVKAYLQVHIMDDCPYQVLLGRPFDVLCETSVKNTKEGGQFITVHDPNSDRRCTIPTYARGQKPRILPPLVEKFVDQETGEEVPLPLEDSEGVKEEEKKEESKGENPESNFQGSLMNC
ncbi:hypothetical protein D9758_003820 [Tetrapyrgos nigripes]|uniref:Uncharacterized protein n=1 Tax=Tetrapyrgos nigripes TaxID=182062 RepID=A0A8H5GLY8_9AGAR|nr:hypothetical protein D9758_003820 [Tetrapyrgos nigripes]